jgi:hypothetical protein
MSLANIALLSTFEEQLVRVNQLVVIANQVTEGYHNTSGVIILTNPSYLNDNVTIEIANGMMEIQGYRFISNAISFSSNIGSLGFSGTGRLGSTLYLTGSLSTSVDDIATSNIASANVVNTVHGITISAFTKANTAYDHGNNAYSRANTAYDHGNNAYSRANTAYDHAGAAFTKANAALANTSGVLFAGNLQVSGNLAIGSSTPASNTLDITGNVSASYYMGNGSLLTGISTSAFPSGTKMLFQQTSAPTGWTKDTTHNNKALRVVSGTAANGGNTLFTAALVNSRTTGAYTLSTSEIPSHSHNIGYLPAGGSINGFDISAYYSMTSAMNTTSAGGGGSHSHTYQLDVQYVDIIIATKD